MTDIFKLSDFVGFLGSIVVVSQYFLNIQGKISASGLLYPLLNLAGCFMIMFSLIYNFNPPSFFIEIFWSSVSIYGIFCYFRSRKRSRKL